MPEIPKIMSNRLIIQDNEQDVVSDVLGALHLHTRVFGRLELGAPWAIRVPANAVPNRAAIS